MRLAMIDPVIPPATWAGMYHVIARVESPPRRQSTRLTTGLKCAPETDPNARMSATSPPAGRERVLEQLETDVAGGEADRHDPRAHHDRDEERGTQEFGERLAHERARHDGRGHSGQRVAQHREPFGCDRVPRPFPSLVSAQQTRVGEHREVVADGRLALAERLHQVARADLAGRRDQAEQSETHGIGDDLEPGREVLGLRFGEGCGEHGPAAR